MMGLDMASIIASHSMAEKKKKKTLAREEEGYYDLKFKKILSDKQLNVLKSIETQLSAEKTEDSSIKCPECSRFFALLHVDGIDIDCCRYCRSYWFDDGELALVTHSREDIPDTTLRSRKSKYACPQCGEIMNEHLYVKGNNLLVDRCPGHGTYLESGELKRAFDALNVQLKSVK